MRSSPVTPLSKKEQGIIIGKFFTAVNNGVLEDVKLCLNEGVNINCKNKKGSTALHIAVQKDNTAIVEFLLKNGALFDIKNRKKETALDIALKSKNQTIVQLFHSQTKLKPLPVQRPDSIHGRMYEVKLLMLFLHRGVSNHYSFHLGSETPEGYKFDDLYFKYDENGKTKFRLLQAKHCKNPTNIMTEHLLTENDTDFSLVKYFFSYVDAKKDKLFENGTIENVIVCTNRDLDLKNLKKNGLGYEEIMNFDDIIGAKDNSHTYHFSPANLIPKLKPLLEHYNRTRLARKLVQCLLSSTLIDGSVETEFFFPYQGALASEVFNTETGLFHDKFIDVTNLSVNTEFRQIFINELGKQSKNKVDIGSLNAAIKQNKIIGSKTVRMILSDNFGEYGSSQWPDNAICNGEIVNFLNALIFAVNQPDEEKLGQIIKNEIGQKFDLDSVATENTYNKLFMTMLNWYQGKERGRFFSSDEGKEFFEEAKRGLPVFFNIQNPVSSFTGRWKELNNLHEALQNGGTAVVSQSVSISGLGGVGKSELAKKYISEYSQDYENKLLWINAENYSTLSESFRRLASDKLGISLKNIDGKEKDVKDIVEDVYRFFSKGKSLFIFDNAENFQGDNGINAFFCSLPESMNKPYVLVTSRNIKWPGNIKLFPLGVFTPEEAIIFINNFLKVESNSQDQDVIKLAKTLQYFPLALQQAVAYIKVKNEELKIVGLEFKIGDYLKRFEEKTKELLNFEFPEDSDNTYSKTTLITWEITLDYIRERENGNKAIKIMNIIAYLAPDNISTEIFSNFITNKEELGSSIYLLKQYSMVNSEEELSVISVHRLVQQVTRINLKDGEKEILTKALKLFQRVGCQGDLFDHNLRLNNVDHAISVWRYAIKHEELVRKFSNLPVQIASELNASLRYQEAYSFGSEVLTLLEKLLGDNHPCVLSMMSIVAAILFALCKDDDSLKLYQKLKEKSSIINKLLSPRVLIFDENIGLLLSRQGKHDEALEIFYNLYSLVEECIISSDGNAEIHLAVALQRKGKLDDAIKMYKKGLQRSIEVLGPDDNNTLRIQNGIAGVLDRQGKHDEALKIHIKVYEKQKKILPFNHPDILITGNNVAISLGKARRYDEALKKAVEVSNVLEEFFPDHPRTLSGKVTIAEILKAQGKYDQALDKFKAVYVKLKEISGLDNSDTLTTLKGWYYIAGKLAAQRKYDQALKEFNYVLEERKKILRHNHTSQLEEAILKTESAIRAVYQARDNGGNFSWSPEGEELVDAINEGQLDVVNDLLNKNIEVDVHLYNVNTTSSLQGLTPLQLAVHRGHREIVDALLNKGAAVNMEDFTGWTALHYAAQAAICAAQTDRLHIVNALLNKGADVNKINIHGVTPLIEAAHNGHKDIAEVLLKVKGMNINVKTDYGVTQLHFAASYLNAEIITMFVKNGANIESTDINGWTPLHDAAYNLNLDAVCILLNSGANINAADNDNKIPLYYTRHEGIEEILESTQKLFDAVRQNQSKFKIQQLLRVGASVNAVGGTDRLTVLHFAVCNRNLVTIEALLNEKPNINAKDEDGWTPLHYACQGAYSEVVELLISKGADLTIPIPKINQDVSPELLPLFEKLNLNS